ncbi:hypothetical protein [Proteiniphilum sp.]|uniref:hypothetical protein n=1 Tax=Proteiniphilum sp. TaxID=1926877 RepID=UPI002B212EB4|nr:hypothetical protein [Proteiniphilum sp.]MEA4918389.1 hypothetical protein [Proteiniphilum sp.]
MKQLFLSIFSVLIPLFSYTQTTLSGTVKNKRGEPLTVTVTVQAKGSNAITGFTTTDGEGRYSLTYKGTVDSLVVTASGVSVGKHSRIVPNRPGQVDFSIEEKAMELKEVTVTAAPIRRNGDTLSYSVSAYTRQNDRTIEDVLKKMPGIKVDASGTISYNQKPINKFYIENLDLLQGRYGIATKNIEAKDVSTVQVMENHQPIKVLADKVFSDAAAINLKLKESARGKLIMTALAGAGYEPAMWNAELAAMYFASRKQNMTTYKGNNAARDLSAEIGMHRGYDHGYGGGLEDVSMLSVAAPSTPPVGKNRYIDNISNSITTNQLFKLDKDMEMTLSAIYYNDRVEKEGYSLSEQFLPGDSSVRIEESIKSLTRTNNLEMSVKLNSNAEKNFFNNSLNIKGNWNNDRGTGITRSNVGDMNETLSQYLSKPAFSVDNSLDFIKEIGKKNYKIFFSVAYNHSPHNLTVTPANYFGSKNLSSLEQSVVSNNLSSSLRTSYGLKVRNVNIDYGIWGSVDLKGLDTELTGTDTASLFVTAADSLKNDLWYNTCQVGINQNYTYSNNGRLKVTLAIPVVNHTLAINDRIPDKSTQYNRWIINPSLKVSYDLTRELAASMGGNFQKNYGNMGNAYTGYIMHSYRSLLRNTIDHLFESRSGGANISLQYRDAFRQLFFNMGANYGKSWSNLLYGFDYNGIMQVKKTIDQPTQSENYGFNFSGSKGFDFWKTTLNVSGGYSEGRGDQLIQDEILTYRSEGYNAGASINTTPSTFINLSYSFGWSKSWSFSEELPTRFPAIRSQNHSAGIWVNPTKSFGINLSGDYRYNSAVNNRNTTFLDARMRYKNGKTEWELECNNLFNVKQYISASYTNLSTYYYRYNLRPRSLLLNVRFKLK